MARRGALPAARTEPFLVLAEEHGVDDAGDPAESGHRESEAGEFFVFLGARFVIAREFAADEGADDAEEGDHPPDGGGIANHR